MQQQGSERAGSVANLYQGSAAVVLQDRRSPTRLLAPTSGHLTFIAGCMFSGKTTTLIRHLERGPLAGTLLFKHALDARYAKDAVVAHSGLSRPAARISSAGELAALKHFTFLCTEPRALTRADLRSQASLAIFDEAKTRNALERHTVDTVGLDEGHFFDIELVDVTKKMLSAGVNVLITALDRDSWGRPFPVSKALAKRADKVIAMTATCAHCGGLADRTQRLTPIVNGCMIGGTDCYEPRCASCWHAPPEPPPP